jgi:hypothetical protein
MPQKVNYSAYLTRKRAVTTAARLAGYAQPDGKTGSIRAMLEGIGAGDIMLIETPAATVEQIAARVDALNAIMPIVPPDAIVPLVHYIAALKRAAIVKGMVKS